MSARPLFQRKDAAPVPLWTARRPVEVVPLRPSPAAGTTPDVAAPAAPSGEAGEIDRRVAELRDEAELEGLRAAQEKIETLVERYLDGIANLRDAVRTARRPVAAEVVDLALLVAREILGRDPEARRELIERVLEETLSSVGSDAATVVRLGPADYAWVKKRRADLVDAGVTFVVDERIRPGGCVVESPSLVLDAAIEARLEAVRDGLVQALGEVPPLDEITEDEEC